MMGAEGPKNVALAAEIADGWLPLYYSPFRQEVYSASLSNAKADFEVTQGIVVNITDDEEKGLIPVKHMLALYIGGMGAKDRNFHKELIGRFGFEAEAAVIQDLYLAGKKDEAAMAVPDQLADEISLVGSVDKIRDRLQAWDETPVTSLNVSARSPAELERWPNWYSTANPNRYQPRRTTSLLRSVVPPCRNSDRLLGGVFCVSLSFPFGSFSGLSGSFIRFVLSDFCRFIRSYPVLDHLTLDRIDRDEGWNCAAGARD